MLDAEPVILAELERLATFPARAADWGDALARAGGRTGEQRRLTRRRLTLVLVLLAAVVIPLTAIAAANNWWFLRFGGMPTPTSAPMIVKTGRWDGHGWVLVAYPSTTDGLCFGITFTDRGNGSLGAGMECGTFAGISRTATTKHSRDMTITYLVSRGNPGLPNYVAGPVIETASSVQIRFTNGYTLRLDTFAAPAPLTRVRFYAGSLPTGEIPIPRLRPGQRMRSPVQWVAGFDTDGQIVACLSPPTAKDGVSPLSDCR